MPGVIHRAWQRYLRGVVALVTMAHRFAVPVVIAAVLITVALGDYVVRHFAIDTSTENMLAANLPFERANRAYRSAFPQESDLIVVVVDGATPELAENAARVLASRLRAAPALFNEVYVPGGGAFFQHNGLLYLSLPQLHDVVRTITAAQPLLASLARDPSLRGFASTLAQAADAVRAGQVDVPQLGDVFDRITAVIDAQLAGRFAAFPWGAVTGGAALTAPQHVFIEAQPRPQYASMQPAQAAIDAIRRAATEAHLDPAHGVRVRLTGDAVLGNDQMAAVTRGAGGATLLSLALVLLVLLVAFRSPRMILAILLTLIMSLVWTAAFALAATGALNLISVTFAVLFIGLGVDFGLQFGMRYWEEATRRDEPGSVPARTAAGLADGLTLAAAAAAVSFYAFVPTRYAGVADLGIISGTSMFIALFATLSVLPALLALLRPSARPLPQPVALSFVYGVATHHSRTVLVVAGVLALAALFIVPRQRFDFDPINLMDPHSEGVRTLRDLMSHSDTSPYSIQVLAPNLAAAQRLARRLDQLPTVAEAITLASFVPEQQDEKFAVLNDLTLLVPPSTFAPRTVAKPPTVTASRRALVTLHEALVRLAVADAPLAASARKLAAAIDRFLGSSADKASAFATLGHRLVGGLPMRLADLHAALMPQRVTLASLPAALRARYVAPNGEARIQIQPKADLSNEHDLGRFVTEVQRIAPDATDTPVMLLEGGRAVVQAFVQAIVTAAVVNALLLWLLLRRVRVAGSVLLPLSLAALYTVAAMVLIGERFNLANIVVVPLLIGLGIAFGIYLVTRGGRELDAAALARTSTPRAVLFSGLTTMVSFGSLAIAPDPGMAAMGKVLTLALVITLVCVLVLIPALISRWPSGFGDKS